jgi:thioesterase domain-containing protein
LYSNVEEEAREYLAELRAVQPKGPYLLGGYCLSGLVALEMADQLIREGENVALLALIDTERPTAARTFVVNMLQRLERALNMVSVIRDLFHWKDRSRAREARNRIRYKMTPQSRREMAPLHGFIRTKVNYQRVIREYVARQYLGRITLILNEDLYRGDRYRGWRGIPIGQLVIKKVAGDHITMFTEHGQELADLILGSVDSAMLEASLHEGPLADIRCNAG